MFNHATEIAAEELPQPPDRAISIFSGAAFVLSASGLL
jgi:hypothetical protein